MPSLQTERGAIQDFFIDQSTPKLDKTNFKPAKPIRLKYFNLDEKVDERIIGLPPLSHRAPAACPDLFPSIKRTDLSEKASLDTTKVEVILHRKKQFKFV